jgi:hypothetical protein
LVVEDFQVAPWKKGREKYLWISSDFSQKKIIIFAAYSTQIVAQHDNSLKKTRTVTVAISVVDRHRVDADANPAEFLC